MKCGYNMLWTIKKSVIKVTSVFPVNTEKHIEYKFEDNVDNKYILFYYKFEMFSYNLI